MTARTVVAEPAVMQAPEWAALEATHHRRARELTRAHRERRARGERHAVEDFLFDYYTLRAGRLERWHPGAGVRLTPDGADESGAERLTERAGWRWYRRTDGDAVEIDDAAFVTDRGPALRRLLIVLRATASRQPHLGCLGLHEWAMAYRQPAPERRHALALWRHSGSRPSHVTRTMVGRERRRRGP